MKYRSVIRRHTVPAFTLLEMVIVLGIISVLLGGSIALIGHMVEAAKLQRVSTDFRALGSALQGYQLNAGNYPITSQGLQALVTRPTTAPQPARWAQVLDKLPPDPWGSPYGYKFPGKKDTSKFELISKGKDGIEGTEDDMSSQDE